MSLRAHTMQTYDLLTRLLNKHGASWFKSCCLKLREFIAQFAEMSNTVSTRVGQTFESFIPSWKNSADDNFVSDLRRAKGNCQQGAAAATISCFGSSRKTGRFQAYFDIQVLILVSSTQIDQINYQTSFKLKCL